MADASIPSKTAEFIDNIQSIINEYMKTSAYSVGISDLIANNKTNNAIISAILKKKREVDKLINQTRVGVFENNTGKTNREEFETRVNSILNKAQEEAGKIPIIDELFAGDIICLGTSANAINSTFDSSL